ncbi:hypothetical protein NQZ68_002628 [Dissostichus eleginoides]|nr:hypothetical protein NQZ68_002628 [Dissostichus eleginoides]
MEKTSLLHYIEGLMDATCDLCSRNHSGGSVGGKEREEDNKKTDGWTGTKSEERSRDGAACHATSCSLPFCRSSWCHYSRRLREFEAPAEQIGQSARIIRRKTLLISHRLPPPRSLHSESSMKVTSSPVTAAHGALFNPSIAVMDFRVTTHFLLNLASTQRSLKMKTRAPFIPLGGGCGARGEEHPVYFKCVKCGEEEERGGDHQVLPLHLEPAEQRFPLQ